MVLKFIIYNISNNNLIRNRFQTNDTLQMKVCNNKNAIWITL